LYFLPDPHDVLTPLLLSCRFLEKLAFRGSGDGDRGNDGMAEEQKSRLTNIIGLITALSGLVAGLIALSSAIKPALFSASANASTTSPATLPATTNAAAPTPQALAAGVPGARRPQAALRRTGGDAAITGADGVGGAAEHGDHAATSGGEEPVTHHDEPATTEPASGDSHKAQDTEE
jgi:hypothetical protein